MADWRRDFFREPIFSPGSPEAVSKAAGEARFIAAALKLRAGMSVLDVCCGTGRHAAVLARRGLRVTGIDATSAYLAQARRHAGKIASFQRADMRRLRFKSQFDAAYNVWTSFGYSSAADDLRALKGVARALKPGGMFLIDTMNETWLRAHFKERSWVELGGGAYRLEQSAITDSGGPVLRCRWTILRPGRQARSAAFKVRLYDQRRLSALMRRAGLKVVRRFLGFGGDRSGKQLVLLARKTG